MVHRITITRAEYDDLLSGVKSFKSFYKCGPFNIGDYFTFYIYEGDGKLTESSELFTATYVLNGGYRSPVRSGYTIVNLKRVSVMPEKLYYNY